MIINDPTHYCILIPITWEINHVDEKKQHEKVTHYMCQHCAHEYSPNDLNKIREDRKNK